MTEQEAIKEDHECLIKAGEPFWMNANSCNVHNKHPKGKAPYGTGYGPCSICGKNISFPILGPGEELYD